MYAFNVLAPHSAHEMLVASPDGQPRKLTVKVSHEGLPRRLDNANDWMEMLRQSQLEDEVYEPRTVEMGDVLIYKLPEFAVSEHQVDEIFSKAERHKTLIIDLRGNPGGAEDVLTDMLGHLFDHEVKVGDRVSRKDRKPVVAKPHGHRFTGKLIVLIDQGSASCSELFARVVQLEKRGTVIGDRSAGYVRESMFFPRTEGAGSAMWYAVQVSVSDLIMADGKSLEHNPVLPDELVVPTASDLSADRDPVLARAIEMAGGEVTAQEAGAMFPVLWKKI
jgi:carboxyl-terminal processing protease